MKKIKLLLIISSIALLTSPFLAKASDIKSGKNIYLSSQETIDGNLYAASNNITIEGEIKGDLIAIAKTITINGRLDGDLIAAAQAIIINGEVNGSVRLVGNTTNINGNIARNINFIGNSLFIEKKAQIGWDLISGAVNTNIAGTINGNVYNNGKNFILSGKIGKNLNIQENKNVLINLSPESNINGDLNYPDNAQLISKNGANISGVINKAKTESNKNKTIFSIIYKILAAVIIGLILIGPGKKIIYTLENNIKGGPISSFFWGLLIFLAAPTLSLILMFTIIGIPLALLIALLWFIALYISKIFTALILGKEINKIFYKNKNEQKNLFTPLLIGIILSWILFSIPFIGWLISLSFTCLGMGALILYIKIKK